MPTTYQWILIDAPLEDVFEFVADPRNTTSYQKQFSRFEPLGQPERGPGMVVDARGRFKGFPVRVRLRVVEFVENERIVSRSTSGMRSSAEWRFDRADGKTRVRFTARYGWPVPILSGALRKMIEAEIDALTELSLSELKRLVEAEARARETASGLQRPA